MSRPDDDEAPRGGNHAGPEKKTGSPPGTCNSSVVRVGQRQIFRLTTPYRTLRIAVTETPRRIKCVLRCSRQGVLGDEAEIGAWIGQVNAYLCRFDNDPRPLETVLPDADLVLTVYGDREGTPTAVLLTDRGTPEWERDALALSGCAGLGVHHVSVYHDAVCPQLRGTGPCNCDAVVRYGRPDGRDVQ